MKTLNNIYIIKNNNEKELYNPDKIMNHVLFACKDLKVSPSDLIMNAQLKITDGIKSKDIQKSLIQAANEMISEENSDYEIVAGRLLVQQIRKEVYNQYEHLDFYEEIQKRVKGGFYDEDLLTKYTKEEIDFFGSKIRYEDDDNLSYISVNQMYSKYMLKSNNKVIETIPEVFMLIPMAVFINEEPQRRKVLILKTYKLLNQRKISFPTPIMNGARTSYKHFISCNLINMGDSVESISLALAKILQCASAKSGIGLNVSHIRGIGADVGKPSRVQHTGILPILKAVEASTGALTQISRNASSNTNIPFYHYEVELFSQLGDSKGTIENRTRHLDQTIILNNFFLKKALNKEDIYLFHTNEVPGLYEVLGNEEKFAELYEKYSKSVKSKHKKKVNAWELLNLFIYERSITGRVYFVFADNAYKGPYKTPVYSFNLCVEISQPAKPLDSENPEIGVCILSNMNLGYSKYEDIPEIAEVLVNFLDNLIDIEDFSIKEAEYAAKNRRALGIGISNLFGFLAKNKLFYNTKDAHKEIFKIMESFYYHLLKSSNDLAKVKGSCKLFNDTKYSEGWLQFDEYNLDFDLTLDWDNLRKDIKEFGLRNSNVSAIPPAGNCILKDQKIQTYEGNLNLDDILKREKLELNNLKRGWYNLKTPLKLNTKDGDSVSNRFYFNGYAEVFDIKLEDGRVLTATKRHKFWCVRNNKKQFISVKDLRLTDEILDIYEDKNYEEISKIKELKKLGYINNFNTSIIDFLNSLEFNGSKEKKGNFIRKIKECIKENQDYSIEDIKRFYDFLSFRNFNGQVCCDYFIAKYGEEIGKQKFDEFKNNSKQSLENFIKRYGEEIGKQKFDEFRRKSDSSSLKHHIEKYGEETGKQKYKEQSERLRDAPVSLKYYLDRGYTIEEAKCLVKKRNSSCSLEKQIQKHGFEEGVKKYKKICETRKLQNRLEYYIEKYGLIQGYIKYKEKNKRCAVEMTPELLKKIHNTFVKKGLWTPKEKRSLKVLYIQEVDKHTAKSKKLLKKPENDAVNYHLDHRFSKKQGFKQNILPQIIGSIYNLEYLPASENIKKQDKCSITVDELAENYFKGYKNENN